MIQNMTGSPEPRVGDVIEVTYSGIMTEESPPSPTGVEKIVVIKRTPDDEIIDPQEDEHLISVTSEGSMIHPFLHFAYSEHWAEDGFLCADGTPAGGELKEWSEESSLPEIEWSEDFTVTYADGVDFQYIMVFNEAREQQDHLFAVSDLSELDSGRYYIGIVVSQKGQYIEQAKQAECTGWVCLLKLVVEHIEGFSSPTEEELRIRFPQYYDLITPKGLEVYVWQTADNVYYCGLLPGTNRGATEDEITDLAANGATVEEMKVILSSYGVTLHDRFELIQMDMDGTNHRVITQLPKQYDLSGGSSGGGSYFFDNGYLIFLAFPSTSNPDYALPVYKIQLETGETTRLFQEDIPLHTVWPALDVSVSNGYLYFPLPQANAEKRAYAEGNLETGRIERVFEDWDEMSSQIVNLDGVLHYFRAGVGLCEYDKATNQESVKFPMDVYCAEVSYTKDYIFMRTSDSKEFTQRTLWALDRDYQLLGKVEQERIGLYFPFLEYTTANAIYFSADGGTITHYIDPHHLDRLELIQLVDPTARSHG